MSNPFSGREPQKLYQFLYEIFSIPRPSGHEEKIADYVIAFARDRGLEYITDALHNVLVRKKGSPGMEQIPPVLLEGHMDIVPVSYTHLDVYKRQALGYTFILSDEDLEKYGDQMWAQGVVNGTGPWKYDEWIDGQYVKFTRNDDFWKGRNTNVDEVYIWYISEAVSYTHLDVYKRQAHGLCHGGGEAQGGPV